MVRKTEAKNEIALLVRQNFSPIQIVTADKEEKEAMIDIAVGKYQKEHPEIIQKPAEGEAEIDLERDLGDLTKEEEMHKNDTEILTNNLRYSIHKEIGHYKNYIMNKNRIHLPTKATLGRALEILNESKTQIREGYHKQADLLSTKGKSKEAIEQSTKKLLGIKKPVRQALHIICEILTLEEIVRERNSSETQNGSGSDLTERYNGWLNDTVKAGKEQIETRLKKEKRSSKGQNSENRPGLTTTKKFSEAQYFTGESREDKWRKNTGKNQAAR